MAARKNTAAKSADASTDAFREFLLELNKLTSKYLGDADVQKAAKAVAESDDDDDDADDDAGSGPKYTEAQLKKKTIKALRKLAEDEGFDPDELADADKDEIIEALLEDEGDDDADEEDADDDDADDEEDEEDADDDDDAEREELSKLTLAQLRKTARDEYGATAPELKGLDKDGIIDLILSADEEDDADVDVDEDQDDEQAYTEDELNDMDVDELREIAEEWGLEVSAKARTKTLVKAILEAQDEEEYDDDDE